MMLRRLTIHEKLVRTASNWLWQNTQHGNCPVVITELRSQAPEHPDAIGFRNGLSILVECKASRADFKADADKHFRRFTGHAMGNYRYYLAPAGMLSQEEMPDGWGLIEDMDTRTVLTRAAKFNKDTDRAYEIDLLCSALRRQIGAGTDSVRCRVYQIDAGSTPQAAIYAETAKRLVAVRRDIPPADDLFGEPEETYHDLIRKKPVDGEDLFA